MKDSTLIALLVVGLFVLALATFFTLVLVALLHGPLLATAGPSFAGLGYTVLGICAAGGVAFFIAADAVVERRVRDPIAAANITRALRAGCAWAVGQVGVGMFLLVGEWALLAAPGLAFLAMGMQFPRARPRTPRA